MTGALLGSLFDIWSLNGICCSTDKLGAYLFRLIFVFVDLLFLANPWVMANSLLHCGRCVRIWCHHVLRLGVRRAPTVGEWHSRNGDGSEDIEWKHLQSSSNEWPLASWVERNWARPWAKSDRSNAERQWNVRPPSNRTESLNSNCGR